MLSLIFNDLSSDDRVMSKTMLLSHSAVLDHSVCRSFDCHGERNSMTDPSN